MKATAMTTTSISRGHRLAATILILSNVLTTPAHANNYGESYGWQFKTSADRANQAIVLDIMERKRGGSYQAPSYTTTIERQYNCGVSATSAGNEGSQSAVANSPSVSGPSALATGNDASTVLNGRSAGSAASSQSNSGMVGAGVTGSAGASVTGSPTQALNSTQTNSGAQTASVTGSSGCSFGSGR